MNNEIYHHGILGQKWGVRRYQNSDGTLTSAGKKRYYGLSKGEVKSKIRAAKKDYRKNENELHTFDGTTGKNWAKVYDEHKKTVKDDTLIKETVAQRDKAYSKAIRTNDLNKAEKYQKIGDDLSETIASRTKEIGESFSQKYTDALLKDIGYNDIEKGRAMLEDYGIKNEWGQYHGSGS